MTALLFLSVDFTDTYNSILSKRIRKKQSGNKNLKKKGKSVSQKKIS